MVHCAASYIPHLSCFRDNVILAIPAPLSHFLLFLTEISLIEFSYPKNPKTSNLIRLLIL